MNINMVNLKKMFDNKELNKISYSNFMYEIYHSKLYEYKDYLKSNNIIKSINISADNIIFEIILFNTPIRLIAKDREIMSFPLYLFNTMKYEADEMNIITYCIDDNDIVFDIGANIGIYTILLNKLKKIETYSFEPIPITFNNLTNNIKINNIKCNIYNIGLSDKNDELTFYLNKIESGASSLRNLKEDNENVELINCQVRKLDDFVKENNINKVDFIKIDIEGSELFAIQGGIYTITYHKPIIFCEMLRKWCKKFDYHPNDIIKLLSNIGYSCYAISNNGINKIELVDEDTIETNFIFFDMNKDKHMKIINKINNIKY